MGIKIAFVVEMMPLYFVSHKEGRKTLEIEAFDGLLTASVQYDYDRRPLSLSGEINVGDKAEIVLLGHRIELYINGILVDEEWPAGSRLFELGDAFVPEVTIDVSEYVESKQTQPSVITSFENAEGWCPGNGVFVGDCMPYKRDNEYHVLYLKDRHHHKSKWGIGAHQWDHISTLDFKKWDIHPMAIAITDATEGSICTGSWIKNGDKEYLYYTIRMGGDIPAPIRRSVSIDGYHFIKDNDFEFTVSDKYHKASARDPKVIMGEDGLFHMFLTTSLVKENKGCLAHYVSKDMQTWQDFGNPIYVSCDETQPECPDYYKYNGKYYLIFSLHTKAHYMVSDKPFEGFTMPKNAIIPCDSVPKCAEWEGKLVFVGFKRTNGLYGGLMTFKAATSDENGELIFEEV